MDSFAAIISTLNEFQTRAEPNESEMITEPTAFVAISVLLLSFRVRLSSNSTYFSCFLFFFSHFRFHSHHGQVALCNSKRLWVQKKTAKGELIFKLQFQTPENLWFECETFRDRIETIVREICVMI
jgi:hypothetical protein